MNTKQSSAFTLLELMVTISILAIVTMIAAPNMSSLMENNRLDTSATALMRSLIATRSEAVSRNQPVVMCRSINGSSCSAGGWESGWISFADTDEDNVLDSGEIIIETFQVESQITIASTATNANRVTFFADGSISEIVSFRVCGSSGDTDDAKTVSLSVTGRPRSSLGASECP